MVHSNTQAKHCCIIKLIFKNLKKQFLKKVNMKISINEVHYKHISKKSYVNPLCCAVNKYTFFILSNYYFRRNMQ